MTPKTATIETGKCTILVVDLAEKDNVDVVCGNCLMYGNEDYVKPGEINLPFDCEIIGWLDEITEEQAIDAVDYSKFDSDYKSATDKLNFLLKSKGVYTVNPHGEKPTSGDFDHYDHIEGGNVLDYEGSLRLSEALIEWQTAQSQLWVNPILLEKKK